MGLLESIAAIALKPSELLAKGVSAVVKAVSGIDLKVASAKEAAQEPVGKAIGLATAAAGVALAAAISPAAVAKVVLPSGTAGQIVKGTLARAAVVGAVAGGVDVVGLASTAVEKTYEVAKKAGEGKDVGDIIKTVGTVVGAGLVGAGVATVVDKVMGSSGQIIETGKAVATETEKAIGGQAVSDLPLTTPTTTISTGTKKRRKRLKTRTSPTISNKVQIIIQNRNAAPQIRKYIKVGQYV